MTSSGKGQLRVSVIIPTYQRGGHLHRLLRALAVQTLPAPAYEVIVIVDGSTDDTCEVLTHFVAPYALRWKVQANAGRATACNAGIGLAAGELIVLLDDDMEPTEGFLEAHAAQHGSASQMAVIGAAPIVVPVTASRTVHYVADKFNRHLQRLSQPDHRFALRDFYSGNLSIRRERLLEIGGFDTDFKEYGNEDLELSVRLRRAGITIAYSPAALAYQHYTKDFAALAQDSVHKGRTSVLLAGKHPEVMPELRLSTIRHGSILRRIVLDSLVRATLRWPATFDWSVAVIPLVTRFAPARMDRAWRVALDYCYLLGAETAPVAANAGSADRRA